MSLIPVEKNATILKTQVLRRWVVAFSGSKLPKTHENHENYLMLKLNKIGVNKSRKNSDSEYLSLRRKKCS